MYPNIQLKPNYDVFPFLEPLILAIAEKHPDWTIEQTRTAHNPNGEGRNYVVGFYIRFTATQEELGQINLGRRKSSERGREHTFEIYNQRIHRNRQRGHSFQTTKLPDAIKCVNKFFFPTTLDESIAEAYRQSEFYFRGHVQEAKRKVEQAHKALEPAIHQYIRENWGDFVTVIPSSDTEAIRAASKIDELYADEALMHSMWDDFTNKKMLTVHVMRDKYIVGQGAEAVIYESDDLPLSIKERVGMLKLVEEKHLLPGVGLRIGNTYIVTQPNQGA